MYVYVQEIMSLRSMKIGPKLCCYTKFPRFLVIVNEITDLETKQILAKMKKQI